MADFSRRDIEEAKKRVREMKMRAESYIGNDTASEAKVYNEDKHTEKEKRSVKQSVDETKQKNDENEKEPEADSHFIILILLLLLSHEGADSKLLLALLYLLF